MTKIQDKNLQRILGKVNTSLDEFPNQQYKLILFASRARKEG
jgi:hypothetical protein